MDNREQRIRDRAHRIWESEGRPEHAEKRHWDMAKQAIDDEDRRQEGRGSGNADHGAGTSATPMPPAETPQVGSASEKGSNSNTKAPRSRRPPKRSPMERAKSPGQLDS